MPVVEVFAIFSMLFAPCVQYLGDSRFASELTMKTATKMTNFTPLQIQIHIEWTYSFVSYDNTPDKIEFKRTMSKRIYIDIVRGLTSM